MTSVVNWNELAIELHARAAEYCRVMEATPTADTRRGSKPQARFFLWEYVRDLCKKPHPEPGCWWWVFAPWLETLLRGPRSLAHLTCLGYYEGTGDKRSPARREWLHFLPENLGPCDALNQLCCMVRYNAEYPQAASDNLLLTTVLLEHLEVAGDSQRSQQATLLRPLLLTFEHSAGSSFLAEYWRQFEKVSRPPFIGLDWASIRTVIHADRLMPTSHFPMRAHTVARLADGELSITDSMADMEDNADQSYFADLKRRANNLPDLVQGIHDVIRGPQTAGASLKPFHDLLNNTDADFLNKLLRYSLWVHDLGSIQEWSHILTIPLWLPPNEEASRGGSLIVYLRSDGLIGERFTESLTNLLGCASSGVAGAAFMAHERARSIDGLTKRLAKKDVMAQRRMQIQRFLTNGSHPKDCLGYLFHYTDSKPYGTVFFARASDGQFEDEVLLPGCGKKGVQYLMHVVAQPNEIVGDFISLMRTRSAGTKSGSNETRSSDDVDDDEPRRSDVVVMTKGTFSLDRPGKTKQSQRDARESAKPICQTIEVKVEDAIRKASDGHWTADDQLADIRAQLASLVSHKGRPLSSTARLQKVSLIEKSLGELATVSPEDRPAKVKIIKEEAGRLQTSVYTAMTGAGSSPLKFAVSRIEEVVAELKAASDESLRWLGEHLTVLKLSPTDGCHYEVRKQARIYAKSGDEITSF